jgi:hypothetical protein
MHWHASLDNAGSTRRQAFQISTGAPGDDSSFCSINVRNVRTCRFLTGLRLTGTNTTMRQEVVEKEETPRTWTPIPQTSLTRSIHHAFRVVARK